MSLFEKISGSHQYKKDYDSTTKRLEQLNFEVAEKSDTLRSLKRDKKNAKLLMTSGETVRTLNAELNTFDTDVFELSLLKFQVKFDNDTV